MGKKEEEEEEQFFAVWREIDIGARSVPKPLHPAASPSPSLLPGLALLDPFTPNLKNSRSRTHKQTDGKYAKPEEWLPRLMSHTPSFKMPNL